MGFKFRGVGQGDAVTVAAKAILSNLSSFTVLAWIMPHSTVAGNIYNKVTGGVDHRELQYATNGGLSALVRRAGGAHTATAPSGLLAVGKWYFVAMTFTLADGINLYLADQVNAPEQVDTVDTPQAGAVTDDSAQAITWGGTAGSTADTFNGQIAGVGLWNRAMRISEIVEQWTHMLPTTGCVDFHRFEPNGRISPVADLTPTRTGNPGIMSSTALLAAQPSPKYPVDPPQEIH